MIAKLEDVYVDRGGVTVLRGVTLKVGEGEAVALIGRNGAGKTTTIRTLMGLNRPKSGRIYFMGMDVTGMAAHERAKMGIGYVPEGRRILPDLTALENLEVAYGGKVPEDTLEWLFQFVPDLKRFLDRKGLYLSGGEQQMLAVARGLVRRPRLLLLDEPLEGLAPKIADNITRTLRQIRDEGFSMLISESGIVKRLEGLATRAYGIDRGEIVYEGTLEGILEDEVARARIWGM